MKIHRTAVGAFEEVEAAQEGGLSRAAGPQDNDDIPLVHRQTDILQHLGLLKIFAYILNPE